MNGLLLIDKPSGPTSHDVVARIRNTARERSVGHTGTLDPMATGLLPLVMGSATRLANYLSGSDKTYEATISFTGETDTDDANGSLRKDPESSGATNRERSAELSGAQGTLTTQVELSGLRRLLPEFTGTFLQVPPNVSAKRVDGHKSYDLARENKAVELKPVEVTVRALEIVGFDAAARTVSITVTATAGFYVRALARDLGRAAGCGAHLSALRRTQSGAFSVADALPLAEAERLGPDVAARLIPPAAALAHFPAVTVNDLGLKRVRHGNPVGPEHLMGRFVPITTGTDKVRVLSEAGDLLALAHARGGELHPAVVLASERVS